MKIAVVGAAGQLGRDVCSLLSGEVTPLARSEIDLTHPESFSVLKKIGPDIVINCAAYNFVDRAESERENAFAVNAWGAGELAKACAELQSSLVHFSTDYVFGLDQTRQSPYLESDAPGPLSIYGLSKLSGEYMVRCHCPRSFVVRTCGLYGLWGSGGKGGNFVETMLRLAGQGKPLRVVADQACTPTFTGDLAEAVVKLIATDRYGLYHLTNAGSCSWHEFAAAIFEESELQAGLSAISSAEFGAIAKRPAYSVLDTIHDLAEFGIKMRPWREALRSYLTRRNDRCK